MNLNPLNFKNMFKNFHDIEEPMRGGVRGGHDLFNWDKVRIDKDRENYLGHSVMAPVGRSQGGSDFLWYSKANESKNEPNPLDIQSEKERIIEMERQAMSKALLVFNDFRGINYTLPPKKIVSIDKKESNIDSDDSWVESKPQISDKDKNLPRSSKSDIDRKSTKIDTNKDKISVSKKKDSTMEKRKKDSSKNIEKKSNHHSFNRKTHHQCEKKQSHHKKRV